MHPLMLSLAAYLSLVFAGTGFAQSKHSVPKAPTALRGSSAAMSAKKVVAKPVGREASTAHSANRPAAKPQQGRAARYGRFMMAPPPPPPSLDTTSPRTLSLVNANTDETLVVTYWSDGAYRRDALDKLNHFLRDWREGAETEMDLQLFDILWHTQMHVGFAGTIEVSRPIVHPPPTLGWRASAAAWPPTASTCTAMRWTSACLACRCSRSARLPVRSAWAGWASIRARASSISIPGLCAIGRNAGPDRNLRRGRHSPRRRLADDGRAGPRDH